MFRADRKFLPLAILVAILVVVPILAYAQADLGSTIRTQIMSDPRSASLTQAQVDEMVTILTQAAQAQGVSASDITWRPKDPATFAVTTMQQAYDVCQGTPAPFCAIDLAFGFLGPDDFIAYMLGLASMGLIWILAETMHRREFPASIVPRTAELYR